ncbi:hypothetical protein [Streptomyces sp. NPDC059063]|uniref:MmyB family transcriptional regulator n=1 Tax=unclassified Streptomyces TaxID=2593676 RepID=UPI00367AA377
MFCDETARSLYTHGDTHARDIVASLRRDAGRHPHDPLLAELVGELSPTDEDFRRWWVGQNVYRHTHGSKHFHHPVAGPLTLNYESLTLPGDNARSASTPPARAKRPAREALLGDVRRRGCSGRCGGRRLWCAGRSGGPGLLRGRAPG